jgi:hypothetical protein
MAGKNIYRTKRTTQNAKEVERERSILQLLLMRLLFVVSTSITMMSTRV